MTSELSCASGYAGPNNYFRSLEGEPPRDLYALVSHEVSAPFRDDAKLAGGNQSKAAQMLGISRGIQDEAGQTRPIVRSMTQTILPKRALVSVSDKPD